MGKTEASIGSALFFFVAPGTVAGIIPYWITRWRVGDDANASANVIGIALIVVGLAALIECFVRFARTSGGTPSPLAPTQRLVVTGLYRFVRNPMYVSVMLLILGQMFVFASAGLMAYAIVTWLAFHIFVVAFEEKRLAAEFPEDYEVYTEHVGRWIPRLTPWKP